MVISYSPFMCTQVEYVVEDLDMNRHKDEMNSKEMERINTSLFAVSNIHLIILNE